MSRYYNSEHISCTAAMLWSQTGGDPEKAVERAINLQRIAHAKCEALNDKIREDEDRANVEKDREAFRNSWHDQGNGTNHRRKVCNKEYCGLDPVL